MRSRKKKLCKLNKHKSGAAFRENFRNMVMGAHGSRIFIQVKYFNCFVILSDGYFNFRYYIIAARSYVRASAAVVTDIQSSAMLLATNRVQALKCEPKRCKEVAQVYILQSPLNYIAQI
jgi:hypothetical protein